VSGRVSQEVLNNTYSSLKDNWNIEKAAISKISYPSSEEQGIYLYSKVQEHHVHVDGVDLQGDKKAISRGAYNYLANRAIKNEHSIGWHPNYKEIFEDWSKDD